MYLNKKKYNEWKFRTPSTDEIDTLLLYYEVNGCTHNLDLWLDNATKEQLERYHDIKEWNEEQYGRAYVHCVVNLYEKNAVKEYWRKKNEL